MYIKITSIDCSRHYINQDQISLIMKDVNNRSWIVIGQHSIEITDRQYWSLTSKLDEWHMNTEINDPVPLMEKVEDLQLSVRSAQCLQNAGITYVYQILKMSETDMLRGIKNLGRKSLNEIKEVLKEKYNTEIGALKC